MLKLLSPMIACVQGCCILLLHCISIYHFFKKVVNFENLKNNHKILAKHHFYFNQLNFYLAKLSRRTN